MSENSFNNESYLLHYDWLQIVSIIYDWLHLKHAWTCSLLSQLEHLSFIKDQEHTVESRSKRVKALTSGWNLYSLSLMISKGSKTFLLVHENAAIELARKILIWKIDIPDNTAGSVFPVSHGTCSNNEHWWLTLKQNLFQIRSKRMKE